ncbi:ETS-like protein pointed, isoform P2/D [Portunus trituberculatus]|uniref:ETS-like protein pointed, isoform P2/D n=1 Tax=Portunus trituberculatus TaxID=210409 RepID=A0A5B7FA50_PORTR|nr:ETS-like protein pointed, isoform P2/D [Portunus trituberculatus]
MSLSWPADLPAPVPPLTPGTTKKMTDALRLSFASWEKEREKHNITKVQATPSRSRLSTHLAWCVSEPRPQPPDVL